MGRLTCWKNRQLLSTLRSEIPAVLRRYLLVNFGELLQVVFQKGYLLFLCDVSPAVVWLHSCALSKQNRTKKVFPRPDLHAVKPQTRLFFFRASVLLFWLESIGLGRKACAGCAACAARGPFCVRTEKEADKAGGKQSLSGLSGSWAWRREHIIAYYCLFQPFKVLFWLLVSLVEKSVGGRHKSDQKTQIKKVEKDNNKTLV